MNTFINSLHDDLKKFLNHTEFDLAGVVPLPNFGDQGAELRALQELVEEKNQNSTDKVFQILIEIKRKDVQKLAPSAQDQGTDRSGLDNVYLSNGKLNIPFLLRNAELLSEASEYPLARKIFSTILHAGELPHTAHLGIGKCLQAEGKLKEALYHYEQSLLFQPTLEGSETLIRLLIKQENYRQSAEVIDKALHLKDIPKEKRFSLHKTAGNSWFRCGQLENAEKHLLKALELEPSADEVRSNLGVLYLKFQKLPQAKRHFQDAIASNPRNALALAGLGSTHYTLGDKEAAYDCFVQSLGLELNNPPILYQLIRCAYDTKRYTEATQLLQEFIQISPVSANLLFSLAGLQFHVGRLQQAKLTTLRILDLQPKHEGALELLRSIDRYGEQKA